MSPTSNQTPHCSHGLLSHNCLRCYTDSLGNAPDSFQQQRDGTVVILASTFNYEVEEKLESLATQPQITPTHINQAAIGSASSECQGHHPPSDSSAVQLYTGKTSSTSLQVLSSSAISPTTAGSTNPESEIHRSSPETSTSQLDAGNNSTTSQQVLSQSSTTSTNTQVPSLRQALAALAQPQSQPRGTKRAYEPQPNRIGAPQTYPLNRFIDEITDFRSLGLSPDEQMAVSRAKRHCSALRTRLKTLDVMIGV